jgi:multidrug efflux pump subunit AcrB
MSLVANGAQMQNNGRFFITLKPRDQRDVSADEVIRRLRPQLAKVKGAALFLQVAQDINVGGRGRPANMRQTIAEDQSEVPDATICNYQRASRR